MKRTSSAATWFSCLSKATLQHAFGPRPQTRTFQRDPGWDELRLEMRLQAEGLLLDLRLESDGSTIGRCLAMRAGGFLVEPTGSAWVRELLDEAAEEWRDSDHPMN